MGAVLAGRGLYPEGLMSAVDRMVVRTRDGQYRTVPQRVAAGLISTGRAKPANKRVLAQKDAGVGESTPLPVIDDTPPVPVDETVVESESLPEEPKQAANKGVWSEYARALGVNVSDDMTKADIQLSARAVVESLDRLSQPAPEGWTTGEPEDEPATFGVADESTSQR